MKNVMSYQIIDNKGVVESSSYEEEILETWQAIKDGTYQERSEVVFEGEIKLIAVIDSL